MGLSQFQIAIGMPLINADNTNLPVRQRYEVDTSGAARAVTLPASTQLNQGDWVEFIEPVGRNQLATNNLTINAGTGTTIAGTTPMTVNVNNIGVLLMYRGTNWERFYFPASAPTTPQATETAVGGAEVANRAETLAGILDTHMVTPTKVRDFVGRAGNYTNINNGNTIETHIGFGTLDANTTTSGAFALSLPLTTAIPSPWRIRLVKTDNSANNVTINRSGTDTFNDGSTSKVISGQHTFVEIINRGTNVWHYQSFSAPTAATQAQALAATDNTSYVTPLRMAEYVGRTVSYTQAANNNATIPLDVGTVFADAGTTAAMTLNMPAAASVQVGHRIRLIKRNSRNLTLDAGAGVTFNDGQQTMPFYQDDNYVELRYRGGNVWQIVQDWRQFYLSARQTTLQTFTSGTAAQIYAETAVAFPTGFGGYDTSGNVNFPGGLFGGLYSFKLRIRFTAPTPNPGTFVIQDRVGTTELMSHYMGTTNGGPVTMQVEQKGWYTNTANIAFRGLQNSGASITLQECFLEIMRHPSQPAGPF